MRKMKQAELPEIKKMLLSKQNGLCPICGKDLTRTAPVNQVLDHCHTTGVVRAVLHRGCNKAEGSVLNTIMRWGKAGSMDSVITTLERMLAFWKLHSTPQTDIIYYNHKTAAEKRAAYNAKRRKTRNAKSSNCKMES